MVDIEMLYERLSDMGFEVDENEEAILKEAIGRAEQTIINYCNCESVPEELYFALLDMAAGEYLAAAAFKGGEKSALKSFSEGDMAITFGDDAVGDLVDNLFKKSRDEMVSFRRLKW